MCFAHRFFSCSLSPNCRFNHFILFVFFAFYLFSLNPTFLLVPQLLWFQLFNSSPRSKKMITADQPIATPPNFIVSCFCFLLLLGCFCSSQKTCPNCGSIQVPYPLSTYSTCGDPNYHLRCDSHSQKLYFDAMNGSSYLVLRIMASFQRMVVQPSPWVSASSACVTQDMVVSEGLRLNQTLPFNLTFSNTIFLYNCSPRLLLTPLNCTPSSLCHRYLESSGHVDKNRALKCAGSPDLSPCCTFVAGGMPSAYRIRLHNSGCKAFRSILSLDPEKPASQWEEGVEIQLNIFIEITRKV
jgi:hypothetical protein